MLINLAYVLVPVADVATGHQRLRLRVQLEWPREYGGANVRRMRMMTSPFQPGQNPGATPGAPTSPARGRPAGLPTPPKGWPIGSYPTYAEAQRAVDYLSDQEFPVQQV